MDAPLTRTVERFIRSRTSIADCLRLGLINHRALARLICESSRDTRLAAAQMAIGRLARRMKGSDSGEEKVLRELRRARVLTRSNMMAVIIRSRQPLSKIVELQQRILSEDDELTVVHGMRNITVILGEEHRESVRRLFAKQSIRILPGLAKIQILVGEQSVFMRGFSAVVYAQIAGRGVNLVQELTCSGEYLILVEERDLQRALEALKPDVSKGP